MALNSHCQQTSNLVTSTISDDRDYIGTESCFDAFSDKTDNVCSPCEGRAEKHAVGREVPPPPMLPSVLKREYTSDGRLLLKEEKVRRHEYLRAHRSNGRLTIQLVSVDDDLHKDSVENGANSCFLGRKLC